MANVVVSYVNNNPLNFQKDWWWSWSPPKIPYFQMAALKGNTWKMRQWLYLGSEAFNKKTKDTFFSSTLKVWESKVSFVFVFMAQVPRYLHFLPLTIVRTQLRKGIFKQNFKMAKVGFYFENRPLVFSTTVQYIPRNPHPSAKKDPGIVFIYRPGLPRVGRWVGWLKKVKRKPSKPAGAGAGLNLAKKW